MIANSLTLSRTIDTDQGAKEHYLFPKYQREYSWGKKDWDAILTDLNENDIKLKFYERDGSRSSTLRGRRILRSPKR